MRAELALQEGLLASLSQSSEPRVLLIRHGDRFPIEAGHSGEATRLTTHGEARTRALGELLGSPPTWALSSPLVRCMSTAELLGVAAIPSSVLGAPGPFVTDQRRGAEVFGEHGTPTVVREQLKGATWSCMRPLAEGAALIHRLLNSRVRTQSGTGIAVSHDAIVMPYITWATGYGFDDDDWLQPLDGVVITETHVLWRGRQHEVPL